MALSDIYQMTIYGRPATKKNSPVMIKGRNLILPSKTYRAYEKDAGKQLLGHKYNISDPIIVECLYYLPDKRWFPDLVGLLQATSDILQKHQVIVNDSQIVGYGDSRIAGLDKGNPRVEITIRKANRPWEKEQHI